MRNIALILLVSIGLLKAERPIVYIPDTERAKVAATWRPNDAYQPERGFCVAYTSYKRNDDRMVYAVGEIYPAIMEFATPYSASFKCPNSPSVAKMHTHPPATCRMAPGENRLDCTPGGPDAYICAPSPQDQALLDQSGDPFAIVQCDQNALIVYYPTPKPVPPTPPLE